MKPVRIFKPIFTLLIVFCFTSAFSQRSVKDSTISAFMFQAAYSFQIPLGDLTEYYGVNSTIGGAVNYKTDQNWLLGAACDFIFGDQISNRSDILSLVATSEGEVIDGNGTVTSLALFERGFHFQGQVGKIFPILNPNPNSGLMVMAGIGYLQHRIRIESQFGTAPQIMGDYAKGYDKMRGGFAMNGELGYLQMSNSRILNFSASVEVVHAFTKNLRKYDFINMQLNGNEMFNDTYLGFKVRWMIPTYGRAPEKYYYN
jgi:hypothetical protein